MQRPLPLLFLDLETTGHEPLRMVNGVLVPWHEIIEIGAVLADQRLNVLAELSVKVRPVHPERCVPNIVNHYPERAARGEWNNAFPLTDGVRDVLGTIAWNTPNQQVVPTGQNPAFDWSFLLVAFALCGITEDVWAQYLHYAKLDTRTMAVQQLWEPGTTYDPAAYSLRNETLARTLGITMESYPHEAINGARQAYTVFKKLRELRGTAGGPHGGR